MNKIEQLEKEIKELKKIAEIKAYQKEISNEIIIDNVAFTREQVFVLNSINAIREYNQNQKAIECLKEVRKYIYDDYEYCEGLLEKKTLTKYGEGCLDVDKEYIGYIDNKIKELEKNNEN